eukprot:GHVP01012712.1.p1 GENE.GHVP01012712.1~~GHVP01012712.1.p1  ORF type:complete len:1731 (-),score=253.00 GHVP01012712.1:883-6075(-)
MNSNIDQEVETEVIRVLRHMYANENKYSVQEVTDRLEVLAHSKSPRDEKLFCGFCRQILHTSSHIPEMSREKVEVTASLTAHMFRREFFTKKGHYGLMIIQSILNSLKDPDPKTFRFGVMVLENILDVIPKSPRLCSTLVTFNTLRETYPRYTSYLLSVLSCIPDPWKENTFLSNEDLSTLPSLPNPPLIENSSQSLNKTPSAVYGNPSVANYISNLSGAGFLAAGANLIAPEGMTRAPTQMPVPFDAQDLHASGLARFTSLMTADDLKLPVPPESFIEIVYRLFNNLTPSNVEQSANEMKNHLKTQYFGWFAYYLVKSRAAKEPNHHPVFNDFLDQLKQPKLIEVIIPMTIECIRDLLRYVDAAKEAQSYRTVLKNLGKWLGSITLARNKALLSKQIDLKPLLLDAYDHGRLIAILPLVSMIMESVNYSMTYKPPNPWTIKILDVFAELHGLEGLATPLVFEIEFLFSKLGINIQDRVRELNLNPSSRQLKKRELPAPSSDFVFAQTPGDAKISPGIPEISPIISDANLSLRAADTDERLAKIFPPLNSRTENSAPVPTTAPLIRPRQDDDLHKLISDMKKNIIIPDSIVLFKLKPHMKSFVPAAIEKAVIEIIEAIIPKEGSNPTHRFNTRSSAVAVAAAKELVKKDFCLDGNHNEIKKAAKLMAATLGASLAMVSCREPLRAALQQNLWKMFGGGDPTTTTTNNNSNQESVLSSQVVQNLATENLALGCNVIENLIITKTVRDMEEELRPLIEDRVKAAQNSTVMFVDNDYWHTKKPDALLKFYELTRGAQIPVYQRFTTFSCMKKYQLKRQAPNPAAPQPHPSAPVQGQRPNYNEQRQPPSTPNPWKLRTGLSLGLVGYMRRMHAPVPTSPILSLFEEWVICIRLLMQDVCTCLPDYIMRTPGKPIEKFDKFAVPYGEIAHIEVPKCTSVPALCILSYLNSSHPLFGFYCVLPSLFRDCEAKPAIYIVLKDRLLKAAVEALGDDLSHHQYRSSQQHHSRHIQVEIFVASIRRLNDYCPDWTTCKNEITLWLIREIGKVPPYLIACLIRNELLLLDDLDVAMAEGIERQPYEQWKFAGDLLLQTYEEDQFPHLPYTFTNIRKRLEAFAMSNHDVESDVTRILHAVKENEKIWADSEALSQFERYFSIKDILGAFPSCMPKVPRIPLSPSVTDSPDLTEASHLASERWSYVATQYGADMSDLKIQNLQKEFFSDLNAKYNCLKFDDKTNAFLSHFIRLTVYKCQRKARKTMPVAAAPNYHFDTDQECSFESPISFANPEEGDLTLMDNAVRLIISLMKYLPNPQVLIFLTRKILALLVQMVHTDCEKKNTFNFDQRPYFRFLLVFMRESIQSLIGQYTPKARQMLQLFTTTLLLLEPRRCPGFAFAWITLLVAPEFTNHVLSDRQLWWFYARNLECLYLYLAPSIRTGEMPAQVGCLYKGTLRLTVALVHDHSEFIVGYSDILVAAVPLECVQLRNVLLSVYPPEFSTIDPFTPTLKIDEVPGINSLPVKEEPYLFVYAAQELKTDMDNILNKIDTVEDEKYVALWLKIQHLFSEPVVEITKDFEKDRGILIGITSVLLYLCQTDDWTPVDLPSVSNKEPTPPTICINFIKRFLECAPTSKEKYMLLSSVVDQLRYPNKCTRYFSAFALFIFSSCNNVIKEQLASVLVGRLIVYGPHPWGVLMTFVELFKNETLGFWECDFVRIPQYNSLWQSVTRFFFERATLADSK